MIKENAIHRLLLLRHRKGNTELLNESLDMAIEALRQPERKTGQWFILDNCANSGIYCSECQKKVFKEDFSDTVRKYNFCPNCGSYNKGDKHENQKG